VKLVGAKLARARCSLLL